MNRRDPHRLAALALAACAGLAGCGMITTHTAPAPATTTAPVSVTTTTRFASTTRPATTTASAAPSSEALPSAGRSPAPDGAARLARVVELTNEQRRAHGLAALSTDRRLTAAAQGQSADMSRRHFFDHENPDGQGPGDRVTAQGYRWQVVAENIAAGPRTPEDVVEAWMSSPGHRANILDPRLTQIGVGYATSTDEYGTYWTQDFGRPLAS